MGWITSNSHPVERFSRSLLFVHFPEMVDSLLNSSRASVCYAACYQCFRVSRIVEHGMPIYQHGRQSSYHRR